MKSQKFNGCNKNSLITGFFINHNNKIYIVSVHHFNPIKKITTLTPQIKKKNELEIKINSKWSEVLICDSHNVNHKNYIIHKNFHTQIPLRGETLYFYKDNIKYDLIVNSLIFRQFDDIHDNIPIPYILTDFQSKFELNSLSGSPIYYGDKIIGIMVSGIKDYSQVFVLPIYIVLKNLDRKNNDDIFYIPNSDIKKIGYYNINEKNQIYHPTLKTYIPVSSYYLLEGDGQYVNINIEIGHELKEVASKYVKYPKKLCNETNITIDKNDIFNYKISTRLLKLMNSFNYDKRFIINMVEMIRNNQDADLWFSIKTNKISMKNK
jgi:hypothetical protein